MSIIIADDVMNTEFDKSGLEKSLPNLAICVRDGNLTYTNPEQLLRRQCRCFSKRQNRYPELAIKYVKNKVQQTLPPAGRRLFKTAK
ncbi:hypothetical protein GGF43_006684, partial [Coemansia sp. RSA 2618]